MNTTSINKFLILLLGMTMGLSLSAQDEGLPSEQVDVVKEFEAKLKNVERLKITPTLPPIDTTSRRLTYFIPEQEINLEYAAPKIRPLAIKGEKPAHSANNKEIENQKFSDSRLGLNGTYYHDNGYAINGGIKYSIDEVHHYGYDQADTTFPEAAVKQQYKVLGIGGSLFSQAKE